MQISAIRLPELSDPEFYFLLEHVSQQAQLKIRRFRHRDDAKRSLIANIVIRSLFCSMLNLRNIDLSFDYNEFGKPYLKGKHSHHYNVSHSGEWIVCGMDHSPIGTDVERIQSIDFGIAKRFFSDGEYRDLICKPLHEREAYFYDLWTLKESYIKAIGKGLSIPLDSFSISVNGDQITMQCTDELPIYYFSQYAIDDHYKFSVCAAHSQFASQAEVLEWEKVLEHFRRYIS